MEAEEEVEGILTASPVSQASEVANLFRQAASLAGISSDLRNNLSDQQARFNTWQSSHKPLSFSNRSEVQERNEAVLLSLLDGLLSELRAILEPEVSNATSNDEELTDVLSESEVYTDSTDTSDDASDSSHQQSAVYPIDDIISRLFRFTMYMLQPIVVNDTSTISKSSEELIRREAQFLSVDGENCSAHFRQNVPALAKHNNLLERHLKAAYRRRCMILSRYESLSGLHHESKDLESNRLQTPFSEDKETHWSEEMFQAFAIDTSTSCCRFCGKDSAEIEFDPSDSDMRIHWQKHVLRDVAPYVCLLAHCEAKNVLFDSTQAWLDHMKGHSYIYACQFLGHATRVFGTCDGLAQHLTSQHAECVPTSMASSIAALGRYPSEDVVKCLILEWNPESYEGADFITCIYCERLASEVSAQSGLNVAISDVYSLDDYGSIKANILDHLIWHQDEIALKTLPGASNAPSTPVLAKSALERNMESSGTGSRKRVKPSGVKSPPKTEIASRKSTPQKAISATKKAMSTASASGTTGKSSFATTDVRIVNAIIDV
ncbi:hypothetical protein CC80DRAFT_592636 [Byssothecium circinans]|uniref:C2H2-type domain-containing protein n=1 Tax=Byssothecium circinans TaxID=147558 RepID=A0A6A5U2Z5_9PLEO|nr:hypothetical protein CC80DRAFT_592636 [Byssothecium circinans]